MLKANEVLWSMEYKKSDKYLDRFEESIEEAAARGERSAFLYFCDCKDRDKLAALKTLEANGFVIARRREWSGWVKRPAYYAEW